MKNKSFYKKLGLTLFTFGLVAILLLQLDIEKVVKTLINVDIKLLVVGFILYFCSYYFRALRFHSLLGGNLNLTDLFHIVCVHNMANNVLPSITGEVSYIYLLNKIHNKTIGEGISTLAIARIFDIFSISILFFLSAVFIKDLPQLIMSALWMILLFVILLVLFLIGLLVFRGKFLELLSEKINNLKLGNNKITKFILNKAYETTDSLNMINKKTTINCLLNSLLIWIFNYSMLIALVVALKIDLTIPKAILGATFMLFTTLLPIHGIGGFGTSEGLWTLVLVPLGLSVESAIIFGFSYHIIRTVYYLIIGGYGFFMLKRSHGNKINFHCGSILNTTE